MNPERWRRIDELFQRAIDTPTADRVALLDRETAGDTSLRREVLALLDADKTDAESDSRVDSAIKSAASLAASGGALVGAMLGPYQVERQIGRGGMGAVYLASRADDQYQKKVAIKLVAFGTDERRFRQERSILARLDHPYIARLIDGGSAPDGREDTVLCTLPGPTPEGERAMTQQMVPDVLGDRFESFGSVIDREKSSHVCKQDLCGTNIGGRFFSANVLLTSLES